MIPAQAEIDQQMIVHFPIVLDEQADLRGLGRIRGRRRRKDDRRESKVEMCGNGTVMNSNCGLALGRCRRPDISGATIWRRP